MYAYDFLLLIGYAVLGASIKISDQAFDENFFSKKIAYFLFIPVALLMGYYIVTDPFSAAIFIAIIVGGIITKKANNYVFLGVGIGILIIAFSLYVLGLIEIPLVYFYILLIFAVLDEIVSDFAGRKKKTVFSRVAYYRPFIKLNIITFVLWGFFPIIYLPAFFLFDLSYVLVEHFTLWRYHKHIKEVLAKLN